MADEAASSVTHRTGHLRRDEPPTLPLEILRLVDAARRGFDQVWQSGDRPSIEPFLEGLEPAEREAVLHELVAREVALRSECGNCPGLREYLERFPSDAPVVSAAFASTLGSPSAHGAARNGSSGHSVGGREPPTIPTGAESTAIAVAGELPCQEDKTEELPGRLGRYRVVRLLGEGSFGRVYLARDHELERDVAIKVPKARSLAMPGRLEALLTEGRSAAALRHAAVVGVYDIGRDDDDSVFIVLEYVRGTTLADLLGRGRIEPVRLVDWIAQVADAVHHAHRAGLVHRDLKPSNIIIDEQGTPRVTDFGLALSEALQLEHAGEVAGTPTYMAPEQVRGEAHRLDGRTDTWALGVILYQGLTDRLPFCAREQRALFDEILNREPNPPRQIDDSIPRELERICLRCLSKRMPERYSSSMDLADDLRAWILEARSPAGGRRGTPGDTSPGEVEEPGAARIVPRGLRAFDKQDAEAFLDLLPGPRGRDGLPESIRFWKARIEGRDGDPSFSVGLLYGPSGCGKSSLMKAGLLPRLADRVISAFVEATPADTETRLAASLVERCHGQAVDLSLSQLLTAIRRGHCLGSDRKLLIVLDQFEQWLQANEISENAELVRALRQCDGSRIQALLIVRDDFWMSVTRFFRMIDVRLAEEVNCGAVELFDSGHAEGVLTEFGRAFGALPAHPGPLTRDQEAFVTRSVGELSQKDQVIPVHLSVFAEMVKGEEWTPATLRDVGGARGLGVKFLDKAFGPGAPPYRRVHERAARHVLGCLLPASGGEIKGRLHSRSELLEASGYVGRADDFEELLRVLDSELKLVTPVDRDAAGCGGEPHYQLTHDFLVPALREWLAARQRETRSGRAELRLAERAALWGEHRERKQLPTIREWLTIALLTQHHRWSRPECEVMRAAARHHLARAAVALVLGIAAAWAAWVGYGYFRAQALVDRLLVAETGRVPGIVEELESHRGWADHALRVAVGDPSRSDRERLHARLALLSTGYVAPESLLDPLLSASPEEFRVILGLLAPYRQQLAQRLWPVATSAGEGRERRMRAACALAILDTDESAWRRIAPGVCDLLLAENPLLVNQWVEILRPARGFLAGPLADASDALGDRGTRRLATSILADYCADDPVRLVDQIVNADHEQFAVLLPAVTARREAAIPLLREHALGRQTGLRKSHGLDPSEQEADTLARQQATAAATLVRLGIPDAVWPLLVNAPDPRLQAEAIDALTHLGADPVLLADRLRGEPDVSARMALLLALADCVERAPGASWAARTIPAALEAYRTDPDPGVHSAARLFLGRAGESRAVRQIDDRLEGQAPPDGRRWFVDGGLTMVTIDPTGQDPSLSTNRSIDRVFAISSTEVTLEQFLKFRPGHTDSDTYNRALGTDPACPAGVITWYDAAAYCRWLDEKTGVPEDQRCYPPIDQIKEGMRMPAGYLRRTGHRLPTFAEWEFAARALASTSRHYGDRGGLLPRYAWFSENSGGVLHSVGSLKPNRFGVFDMHGSLLEWCQESIAFLQEQSPTDGEDLSPVTGNRERILRSGAFNNPGLKVVVWYLGPLSPMTIWDNVGIRVVRTIRPAQ